MAAVIGALRVALGLDSAQFSAGLKNASNNMGSFVKAATIGFAAITAAATGAFLGIKSAAERADDAFKASQSLGIAVGDLGRLGYAAEMSGASFETLSAGIRKASQAFAKSAAGAANDATKALRELGVSAVGADGKLRPTVDVIGDVAEAFSKLPDGANKTNAAMAIFGKSGASLIPTLNMGRDGLREMGDEAERLGLVFSEETGEAAEGFNDNLMRLNLGMTGLWNRIMAGVIPAFAGLSNKIVAATQNGGVLDTIVGTVSAAMNLLTKAIGFVVDNLDTLVRLFKVFVAAKLILYMSGMIGTFINFARTIRVTAAAMAAMASITRAKIVAILLLGAAIAEVTGTLKPMVEWLEKTGKALVDALPEGIRSGIDDLSGGLLGLGDDIDAVNGLATENMATYLRIGTEAPGQFGKVEKSVTKVGQAIGETKTLAETFADVAQTVSTSLSSGFSEFTKAALTGGDAIGVLIGKVGDLASSLADMFLNNAFQSLFGGLTGALFGTGGMGGLKMLPGIGGLTGSVKTFAGGGYTGAGSRTGGLDGMGGFLAMMHPNESVVDHTAGQRGGDVYNFTINAPNSTKDAAPSIANEVRRVLKQYEKNPYRAGGS